MSRSLKSSKRSKIKAKRGYRCELCCCVREKGYGELLDIHHVDGRKKNNSDKNLMVLCGKDTESKCHEKIEDVSSVVQRSTIIKIASGSMSVREKESFIKRVVNYSDGSKEMQTNELAEYPFRKWVYAILKNLKKIEKAQLIDGGAEEVGVNIETTTRYLKKMISITGKLEEYKDPDTKRKMIRFKKKYVNMEIDELN